MQLRAAPWTDGTSRRAPCVERMSAQRSDRRSANITWVSPSLPREVLALELGDAEGACFAGQPVPPVVPGACFVELYCGGRLPVVGAAGPWSSAAR